MKSLVQRNVYNNDDSMFVKEIRLTTCAIDLIRFYFQYYEEIFLFSYFFHQNFPQILPVSYYI